MSAEMMNKNLFFILFSAIILIASCDEQLSVEEAKSDPITNPQFVFMRESNLLYFAASYELEFEEEFLTSAMVEWSTQSGNVTDTIWLMIMVIMVIYYLLMDCILARFKMI